MNNEERNNIVVPKGIVLVEVAGEYMLVATREGRENNPYCRQINENAAYFWDLLTKGKTPDEIISETAKDAAVDDDVIRKSFDEFIEKLQEQGYQMTPKKEDNE